MNVGGFPICLKKSSENKAFQHRIKKGFGYCFCSGLCVPGTLFLFNILQIDGILCIHTGYGMFLFGDDFHIH